MSKFIVLEGITSTGKTTQGKMLVDRLNVRGAESFFNHEPTISSPFGRLIRAVIEKDKYNRSDISLAKKLSITLSHPALSKILLKLERGQELTEIERQMLYIADRHEDLRNVIVPQIARGIFCVQDRYELSTYAFAATKNITYGKLSKLHSKLLNRFYVVPDILIYFDLDPEIAIERLSNASSKPVDIYETLPKIKKTRSAYIKLLKKKELYKKLYIIDSSQPLLSVFREICIKIGI